MVYLTRVSEMSFLLLIKTEKRYLCLWLRLFVSLPSYVMFSFFSLVKYLSRHKVVIKKRIRFFSNSLIITLVSKVSD